MYYDVMWCDVQWSDLMRLIRTVRSPSWSGWRLAAWGSRLDGSCRPAAWARWNRSRPWADACRSRYPLAAVHITSHHIIWVKPKTNIDTCIVHINHIHFMHIMYVPIYLPTYLYGEWRVECCEAQRGWALTRRDELDEQRSVLLTAPLSPSIPSSTSTSTSWLSLSLQHLPEEQNCRVQRVVPPCVPSVGPQVSHVDLRVLFHCIALHHTYMMTMMTMVI
jgi:hypothetical protein